MAAVKQNILKRWDTAPAGVKICSIKFVQKVVQVQTPGMIDPRVRNILGMLGKRRIVLTYYNSGPTRTKYR